MTRIAVFGYGSLVSAASVAETLGRAVPELQPARLRGWHRRWSAARDNLRCEKTFELTGGECPPHVLGLNLEPGEDAAGPVNGVLIELSGAELERLDLREPRYDQVEVTEQIDGDHGFDLVVTYSAKPANLATTPPPGSVILDAYVTAVESAFEALGEGELDTYRATTGALPAARVEAKLKRGRIPPGNPRTW